MSRLKSLSYFLFDISHLLNINYDNNLHSNMFLLILTRSLLDSLSFSSFTFHNVSINSQILVFLSHIFSLFTFHNVSINSELRRNPLL